MRSIVIVLTLSLVSCSAPQPGSSTVLDGGLPTGTTGNGGTLPMGSGATTTSEGTAPVDGVTFTGGFSGASSGVFTFGLGGSVRSVTLIVPASRPANAPLVIAFHGTGGTPSDFFDEAQLRPAAEANGVIIAAPQALERNGGRGEAGDPDHFEGSEGWATSWNLSDKNPETNGDLLLVRAIIQSARNVLHVDSDRVFVLGHSNGAFFSYFVAASLPDRIAAFAENAGGAVRCAHREAPGAQFTGTAPSCSALSQQSGFPSCSGALQPAPVPGSRMPLGFLAHAVDDNIVSVAWTCTLATALGSRAYVVLQVPAAGERFGHAVTDDFASSALAFFKRYRRQD